MKRFYMFAFIFIVMGITTVQGQVSHGRVLEGLTVDSDILEKEVRYTVYLPFDYDASHRYYPVLYLLHGYTDNDMGWIQFGEAPLILDEAIASREITSMIVIMPDAGVSWYINDHKNENRYEDFFIEEFMPKVEAQYRIRAEKRYRAVAGLSMGGFGSLVYAMKHPNLFSACVAFSAAIYTEDQILSFDQDRWDHVEGVMYGPGLKGRDRLTEHLNASSPLWMAKNREEKDLKSVRFYLDCGDDDRLSLGNAALHTLFKKRGVPHEYRVRNGKHEWRYWRSGLVAGLAFISSGFHQ